jgi:poly(A) polymerase/tRNA nucleotidyltransferase (CCA-adding enzyme)
MSVRSYNKSVLDSIVRACSATKAEAYIVGGMPRDKLLKRECKDVDILVINKPAITIAEYLHKKEGFHRPVIFKRFGTIRVGRDDIEVEIVNLRDKDLKGDLLHRDFTVNTLLMNITENGPGQIIDMLECGINDIKEGILRTPVDPVLSIQEDPVRMMRAFRFSAVLGFKIAPELEEAIKNCAELIKKSPAERVRDEFEKIILSSRPSLTLEDLHGSGLLAYILPELDETYEFDQHSPYHHEDLFHHTLSVIDRAKPELEIRLSALFHDLGKKDAQRVVNEKVVHYGHQDYSVMKTKRAMRRLRFPKKLIETVTFLVQHHMVQYTPEWSDSAVRRFVRKMGSRLDHMLELLDADWGSLKHKENFNLLNELKDRISKLKVDEIIHVRSPIDGHEIQKILGIPEGPEVGRAKDAIVNAIIEKIISPTPAAAKKFLLKNRKLVLKGVSQNQ